MSRALITRRLVTALTVAGLTLGGGGVAVAAGSGGLTAAPTWTQLRHQFDYQRGPIHVTELGETRQGNAIVHDITYRAAGQDPVSAYLVVPTQAGRHSAAMFLHWLDGPDDSNRGEFLAEAVSLASGAHPVVSLLPQLTFPFDYGPVGNVRDRQSVISQVIQLRRGLDLLDARSDVDAGRVAVVGHDYGAMYASILDGIDRSRIRSAVVMAADSTMADWFVEFFLSLPADQVAPYTAMLSSVDPIAFIGHAPGRLLLQYATDDFFIPISVADDMAAAAGPHAVFRTYDVDHSMDIPAAQRDRDSFLLRTLAS
jgi:pimeloyl-ACP methyl ester carboxylesterase